MNNTSTNATADKAPRKIYLNINSDTSLPIGSNSVSTKKYTPFTFIFKFLFEQFKKYANVFFLATSIIQQIPGVSPTSTLTTILPLLVVLFFTAIKELFEDTKRGRQDEEANNRMTRVITRGSSGYHISECKWKDVAVGDLVRVEAGEFIPADLIILSSSEPDAICYIETSSLDGETNLKIRQGRHETSHVTLSNLSEVLNQTMVETEQPQVNLYTYEAVLFLKNQRLPLDSQQLLLRGAMLRNTRWIYGIVVYTGHETKLLLNATAAPIKRTRLESQTNTQILMLFFLLVLMALISSFGYSIFTLSNENDISYLYILSASEIWRQTGWNVLTFIVLYNNLIPISLIVSMEVVRMQLAYFIGQDLDMYYEKTDTPAQAKTSSVVEELGQVEYIFSDKTGTLTRNEMEFKECFIAGIPFSEKGKLLGKLENEELSYEKFEKQYNKEILKGSRFDFKRLNHDLASVDSPYSHYFRNFFILLTTCHTVIPEVSPTLLETSATSSTLKHSDIVYQASSPDEAALLKGAQPMMYFFHSRKPKSVIVNIRGEDEEFEICAVNEFSSTRKRMSIIVKVPPKISLEGSSSAAKSQLVLFVKGADSVITPRLKGSNTENLEACNPYLKQTLSMLEEYATEGLRTLCLAMRSISDDEFSSWFQRYQNASSVINNRQNALEAVAEEIETELFLLGATAVEDKLQEGVPDTIYELSQAGIKLWVLTGDRQETAINIGYSCKLLNDRMKIIILNEKNDHDCERVMKEQLEDVKHIAATKGILFPEGEYESRMEKKKWTSMSNEITRTLVEWGWLNLTPERELLLFKRDIESVTPDVEAESPNYEHPDAFALVVDGHTLQFCLNEKNASMRELFLKLATKCQSVVCCRVSPLQKAQIVRLVKKNMKAISLAIGDGANDVGMIQAASIGVGISGHEGLQAARSADFAISQFRFLKKLLLVHGLWSYTRLSKLILFSFYKNITLYLTQFWFSFFNGFSGETIYESWVLSMYNVFFTLLPPFAIGVFDQIVTAKMLEKYPQIYSLGRKGEMFNVSTFWGWAFNGIYHSFLLYFLVILALGDTLTTGVYAGLTGGLFYSGIVLYTSVLVTVYLKAALTIDYWTKFTWIFVPGSFVLWLIIFSIYSQVAPHFSNEDSKALGGILSPLFANSNYWFVCIVVPVICLTRDVLWKYFKRQGLTRNYHVIQEIQKYNLPDYGVSSDRFGKLVRKVRNVQRLRNGRGYAFSQNESGQTDLIKKYDTTQEKLSGK